MPVRLSLLADVLHAFADATTDYPRLLDVIVTRTADILGHACSVRLLTADGEHLETAAFHDPIDGDSSRMKEVSAKTIALPTAVREAFASGHGKIVHLVVEDAVTYHAASDAPLIRGLDMRSVLHAPLIARGEPLGVLFVVRRGADSKPLVEQDRQLAEALAAHAALAIANARLMIELGLEREQRLGAESARRQALTRALLFDSMSEAVIGTDEAFFIEEWNPAAEKLFGWTADEAKGRQASELLSISGVDREVFRKELRESAALRTRMRIKTRAGRWLDVQLSSTPLRNADGPTGFVSLMLDVTEQLRLERDAKRQLEELVAANAELDSFSYSVSHDLRAPVRAIEGFARILAEDHGAKLDEEGARLLGIVRKNASRMGQLIDELLAFSRLGRKAMAPISVDMDALARETAAEATRVDASRTFDVAIGALPRARCDHGLIRQVWFNLLSNAVKYTRGRTPARIVIDAEETPDEVVYAVRDNGAGFDMRYEKKLFGVFERLHSEKEFEGTGVGLALVARILQRHGGRVWGEGTPGVGATFRFALPRSEVVE